MMVSLLIVTVVVPMTALGTITVFAVMSVIMVTMTIIWGMFLITDSMLMIAVSMLINAAAIC